MAREVLSSEIKKVLHTHGDYSLVYGVEHVQFGYEAYGDSAYYAVAEKDKDGNLHEVSDRVDYPEAEKVYRQKAGLGEDVVINEHLADLYRTKKSTEQGKEPVAAAKAPDPEKSAEPEKSPEPVPVPASEKPTQKKAQEQTTDQIMQDFPKPQAIQPLSMTPQASRAAEFEHRKKPYVLLANPRGKPLVLDHGDRISVTRRALLGFGRSAQEKREHAVQTALQAAAQRFGEPVHFQGNPAFLRETAAQAVKLGIALEPHDKLAAEIYRQAQERAERERHPQIQNSLGQSQEAKREISKQLDDPTKSKGLGLGL
jgi:hypothetical protein